MPLNSPGYIRLNPHIAYVIIPIAIIVTFLNRTLTVFFDLVNPDSRVANPKCIINTRSVDIKIHRLFIVNISMLVGEVKAMEDISTKKIIFLTIIYFAFVWFNSMI